VKEERKPVENKTVTPPVTSRSGGGGSGKKSEKTSSSPNASLSNSGSSDAVKQLIQIELEKLKKDLLSAFSVEQEKLTKEMKDLQEGNKSLTESVSKLKKEVEELKHGYSGGSNHS